MYQGRGFGLPSRRKEQRLILFLMAHTNAENVRRFNVDKIIAARKDILYYKLIGENTTLCLKNKSLDFFIPSTTLTLLSLKC